MGTVNSVMLSNMLHLASVLLIVTVWFSGDTVALQQLDRQEECSDGAGCRFLTMGPGCDVNPVAAARCPKTCGACPAEDPVTTTTTTTTTTAAEPTTTMPCEDAFPQCAVLIPLFDALMPNLGAQLCELGIDEACMKSCNSCP